MNDRTSGAAADAVGGGKTGCGGENTDSQTRLREAGRDLEDLIVEARALALYVSRHGDALSSDNLKLHEELLAAIAKVVDEPSTSGWRELMTAYAKVTAGDVQEPRGEWAHNSRYQIGWQHQILAFWVA